MVLCWCWCWCWCWLKWLKYASHWIWASIWYKTTCWATLWLKSSCWISSCACCASCGCCDCCAYCWTSSCLTYFSSSSWTTSILKTTCWTSRLQIPYLPTSWFKTIRWWASCWLKIACEILLEPSSSLSTVIIYTQWRLSEATCRRWWPRWGWLTRIESSCNLRASTKLVWRLTLSIKNYISEFTLRTLYVIFKDITSWIIIFIFKASVSWKKITWFTNFTDSILLYNFRTSGWCISTYIISKFESIITFCTRNLTNSTI